MLNLTGFALCLCPYGGKANITGLAGFTSSGKEKSPEVFLVPLVRNSRQGASGLKNCFSYGLNPSLLVSSGFSPTHLCSSTQFECVCIGVVCLHVELLLIGLLFLKE